MYLFSTHLLIICTWTQPQDHPHRLDPDARAHAEAARSIQVCRKRRERARGRLAPGCRPLICRRPPTCPAHGPSTPTTSRAIGGALIAHGVTCQHSNEVISGRDRAEERADSSSETHCDGTTRLVLGPGGPRTPPEASARMDRRPEGSGDARTAAGMLTG